jgi:hypothetical protein
MFAQSGLAGSLIYGDRYEFNWLIGALLIWPVYIALPLVRLFMVLPAIAIERAIGFAEAWSMTKGMTWRMVAIIFLCALPFLLFRMLIALVAPELPRILSMQLAVDIAVLATWFLQVGVAAAALSLTYRWIIQAKQSSAD